MQTSSCSSVISLLSLSCPPSVFSVLLFYYFSISPQPPFFYIPFFFRSYLNWPLSFFCPSSPLVLLFPPQLSLLSHSLFLSTHAHNHDVCSHTSYKLECIQRPTLITLWHSKTTSLSFHLLLDKREVIIKAGASTTSLLAVNMTSNCWRLPLATSY